MRGVFWAADFMLSPLVCIYGAARATNKQKRLCSIRLRLLLRLFYISIHLLLSIKTCTCLILSLTLPFHSYSNEEKTNSLLMTLMYRRYLLRKIWQQAFLHRLTKNAQRLCRDGKEMSKAKKAWEKLVGIVWNWLGCGIYNTQSTPSLHASSSYAKRKYALLRLAHFSF